MRKCLDNTAEMNCEEIVEINRSVFRKKKIKQLLKPSKAVADFYSDLDRKIRMIFIIDMTEVYITHEI